MTEPSTSTSRAPSALTPTATPDPCGSHSTALPTVTHRARYSSLPQSRGSAPSRRTSEAAHGPANRSASSEPGSSANSPAAPGMGSGHQKLIPMPMTTQSPSDSTRIPPTFDSPTSRSLGHLRVTSPGRCSMAASAATRGISDRAGAGHATGIANDAATARGAVTHTEPIRPRPSVWRSATTSTGESMNLARASAWVLGAEAMRKAT